MPSASPNDSASSSSRDPQDALDDALGALKVQALRLHRATQRLQAAHQPDDADAPPPLCVTSAGRLARGD